MNKSFGEILNNRKLVRIQGEDAAEFLNSLVTCEVLLLADKQASFGALLTPQGKILFDFFLIRDGDVFLIDIDADMRDDFIKRMMFYRLRRKVEIEQEEQYQTVAASWGAEISIKGTLSVLDPRLVEAGMRHYCKTPPSSMNDDYTFHRLSLGLVEGGADFEFGSVFPHEALMDQFGGVDFQKGCYVGQEVVSRMQHRTTVRKRFLKVSSASPLPDDHPDIRADGKVIGKLGCTAGTIGLALLRMDRVQSSQEAGIDLMAGDCVIEAEIQAWAKFDWPQNNAET